MLDYLWCICVGLFEIICWIICSLFEIICWVIKDYLLDYLRLFSNYAAYLRIEIEIICWVIKDYFQIICRLLNRYYLLHYLRLF